MEERSFPRFARRLSKKAFGFFSEEEMAYFCSTKRKEEFKGNRNNMLVKRALNEPNPEDGETG